MRIVYLAAGAAGNYCGACARDVTLVRGLTALGHDVMLLPLYTPLRADGPDQSAPRVFYGGISVYLQQHSRLFRRSPAWFDRLLASRPLLRLASRFAVRTRPEVLGEMTVSVLEGRHGRQRKELDKLIDFLGSGSAPDVVNLTNSLLIGLAPAIRERLGVPVVCTLQGEETFVRELPGEHRARATAIIRRCAPSVTAFVAPGHSYADEMSEFLSVPRERVKMVRTGIETEWFARPAEPRPGGPLRICFLARMSRDKGLHVLCDAFRIAEERRPGRFLLALAGGASGAGRKLWSGLRRRLQGAGLGDRVEYTGELDFEGKVRLFHACDVFCQPGLVPEPRGISCLEAMAAGLPAVVSDMGIFPEIAELTGGAACVRPGDAAAVADVLCDFADDPERLRTTGQAAAAGVAAHFGAARMAEATLAIYREVIEAG